MVRGFVGGCAAFAAVLLLSASPAAAKLYRYTDNAGRLHVVDNPRKVPPMYHDQLAPEDRPDPETGAVQGGGDSGSSLPTTNTIQAPASATEESPTSDPRQSLRERNRDSCLVEIQQLKDRKAALDARYQAWASVERDKGAVNNKGTVITCSSGDAKACIESNRKIRLEKEMALLESSPFISDYRTIEAKAKQLERRCRD